MARPRQYDDALRRRLLDLASEQISAHGVDTVSVRTLAQRAGTTTAAIYTLFGSRDALVDAVATEGLARFEAHLRAVPRTDEPAAELLNLCPAYRTSAMVDPHCVRVIFSADGVPAA